MKKNLSFIVRNQTLFRDLKKAFKGNFLPKLFIICIAYTAFFSIFTPQVFARVTRVEILSRGIFANGMRFGSVGAYEKIRGRLHYAVDPNHPPNARIVDLKYAPRNADGMVVFSGDFLLLKPLNLEKSNHRLLYDVNNRGNLYMLRALNNARWSNNPLAPEHAGNGFLMKQGYSLLWSAWNWDVRPGSDRLQIELPIAIKNGKSITQKIAAEIVLSFSGEKIKSMPFAWGNSRCYPVDDADDNSKATLTVRDEPRGKREEIPRSNWRFARLDKERIIPNPTHLYLESGFEPGKIYELIYTAKNPRVVGLGLAAVRDAISFFRYKTKDDHGTLNPLVFRDIDLEFKPDTDKAYIFGISQSGRFITHMIYEGFYVDEEDQMVFDGARIHVAGGGKGGFNHRFAQTTHHPSHLEGNYMPADFFPFNYGQQKDALTGKTGDVLAVAKKLGKVPYIMITNNELEYWTRSASLIHTDIMGKKDAPVHENVRIYMTNGAPHGNAGSRNRGIYEHPLNPLNHSPILRALLVALDRWASKGVEPPPSLYPRIKRRELVTAAEHKKRFPKIPGMRHPGKNLQPPRVYYGDRFWSEGIFSVVPPKMGEPYITLVPNFDSDGNGVGGIRLPELQVPLGTYQGWNPRRPEFGAQNYLGRFEGSFWAFAKIEEERNITGDPRPSIEERYSSKKAYVENIIRAVRRLIKQGFLLKEDGENYIARAKRMAWPPEELQTYPFWKIIEE
jgi:hypothetical protein